MSAYSADGKIYPETGAAFSPGTALWRQREVIAEASNRVRAHGRSHLIRLNTREGTFALTSDGHRAIEQRDGAATDSGVRFSEGWFAVEGASEPECYRRAAPIAELHLADNLRSGTLLLEIEPGPGIRGGPLNIQLVNADSLDMGSARINGRSK